MAGFRQTPIVMHSSQKSNDFVMHEWYHWLTLLSSTSSFSTVGCSAVLVASTVGCSVVTAMTNNVLNLRTSKTGWWVVFGVWKRDGQVVVVCNELHAWNVNQSSKRRREKLPRENRPITWPWQRVIHSIGGRMSNGPGSLLYHLILHLLRKPFPWLQTSYCTWLFTRPSINARWCIWWIYS